MKILLVKTSALGDVVHLFPALAYLRHHYPEAQIDWLVGAPAAGLVESHPLVDRPIVIGESRRAAIYEVRKERYDLLIDFQGNCKSGLFTLLARAKRKVGFGGWALSEWPNRLATRERFTPPKGENVRVDYLFLAARALGRPVDKAFATLPVTLTCNDPYPCPEGAVVVCPGSAQANKQLSEEQLILQLERLDRLYLFIWGSEAERQLAERLQRHFEGSQVVPKLSFARLQNLMASAALVVSMDSMALHLCATTETPSLSFFGPSSAKKYAPMGERHVALQGSCPYGRTFEKRCPILRTCPTAACMRELGS